MKLLISTLLVAIFLFNGCAQPAPEEKIVYVDKTIPHMKNLKIVNIDVPHFNLYKEDHNQTFYRVPKEDLIRASKTSQLLRYKLWQLDKNAKFYRYQNNKLNNLKKKKVSK